jgi:hypothetical protein
MEIWIPIAGILFDDVFLAIIFITLNFYWKRNGIAVRLLGGNVHSY